MLGRAQHSATHRGAHRPVIECSVRDSLENSPRPPACRSIASDANCPASERPRRGSDSVRGAQGVIPACLIVRAVGAPSYCQVEGQHAVATRELLT